MRLIIICASLQQFILSLPHSHKTVNLSETINEKKGEKNTKWRRCADLHYVSKERNTNPKWNKLFQIAQKWISWDEENIQKR